jgi:hypothetical protein
MRIRISRALVILSVTFIAGCYYDKEELVYPPTSGTSCDTTAVRYSTDIVNILQANCYSCHGGTASFGGGNKLDAYTSLQTYATNGSLLGAITHSPGYPPMPQGGAKLSDCNIAKIRTWIRTGAPNN